MLKAPSRPARNLLDLADLIETIKPEMFDMRHWCSCACGHYMRSHQRQDVGNWRKAAEMLGIPEDMARVLFCCDSSPKEAWAMLDNPKQAAERIRKFAFSLVD